MRGIAARQDDPRHGLASRWPARGAKPLRQVPVDRVKATISSKSTFTKRFKQRRTGYYRVRIHYAGSAIAPATTIYGRVHITRRVVYR